MTDLLRVEDLDVRFDTPSGPIHAVKQVDFRVRPASTVAIVGESGSGKSVISQAIMQILPRGGHITGGRILFADPREHGTATDIAALPPDSDAMRMIRGGRISIIFQEPMTSLNPVMRIGRQITEPLMLHQGLSKRQADQRAAEMLDLVRIADARRRLGEYPHQLSGGMRQRVMIAMALACRPDILIADEPTTALDVTIQAQILQLLRNLQRELGMAVLLISHNLGVIAGTVQRVVVMYAGRKVEEAPVSALFRRPRHPYTAGLLGSVPRVDRGGHPQQARLAEIPGMPPGLGKRAPGCAFAPRCALATEECRSAVPPLEEKAPRHWAACWESARLAGDATKAAA